MKSWRWAVSWAGISQATYFNWQKKYAGLLAVSMAVGCFETNALR